MCLSTTSIGTGNIADIKFISSIVSIYCNKMKHSCLTGRKINIKHFIAIRILLPPTPKIAVAVSPNLSP